MRIDFGDTNKVYPSLPITWSADLFKTNLMVAFGLFAARLTVYPVDADKRFLSIFDNSFNSADEGISMLQFLGRTKYPAFFVSFTGSGIIVISAVCDCAKILEADTIQNKTRTVFFIQQFLK